MGNKRSERTFSRQEERIVTAFIDDVCRQLQLDLRNVHHAKCYRNIGWEGFLEVYREQPGSFQGNGQLGWSAAALAIQEKLLAEKRAQDLSRYQELSLDAPLAGEDSVPRIELLGFRRGDHQNSVCFWDYLDRLALRDEDAGFLAHRLIDKETLDEIQLTCRWSPERIGRAFNILREAMEDYLRI